jgi:hypothetical protein
MRDDRTDEASMFVHLRGRIDGTDTLVSPCISQDGIWSEIWNNARYSCFSTKYLPSLEKQCVFVSSSIKTLPSLEKKKHLNPEKTPTPCIV